MEEWPLAISKAPSASSAGFAYDSPMAPGQRLRKSKCRWRGGAPQGMLDREQGPLGGENKGATGRWRLKSVSLVTCIPVGRLWKVCQAQRLRTGMKACSVWGWSLNLKLWKKKLRHALCSLRRQAECEPQCSGPSWDQEGQRGKALKEGREGLEDQTE